MNRTINDVDFFEIVEIVNIYYSIESSCLNFRWRDAEIHLISVMICKILNNALDISNAIEKMNEEGIVVIRGDIKAVMPNMTSQLNYERTSSIGILKALGASRKNIKWLFITESALIGFIGDIL